MRFDRWLQKLFSRRKRGFTEMKYASVITFPFEAQNRYTILAVTDYTNTTVRGVDLTLLENPRLFRSVVTRLINCKTERDTALLISDLHRNKATRKAFLTFLTDSIPMMASVKDDDLSELLKGMKNGY